MYGKRKYRQVKNQQVKSTQSDNSKPTFICSRCKILKYTDQLYATLMLDAFENGYRNYRLCESCTTMMKVWLEN